MALASTYTISIRSICSRTSLCRRALASGEIPPLSLVSATPAKLRAAPDITAWRLPIAPSRPAMRRQIRVSGRYMGRSCAEVRGPQRLAPPPIALQIRVPRFNSARRLHPDERARIQTSCVESRRAGDLADSGFSQPGGRFASTYSSVRSTAAPGTADGSPRHSATRARTYSRRAASAHQM